MICCRLRLIGLIFCLKQAAGHDKTIFWRKTLIWIVAGLAVVALVAGGCAILFLSGLVFGSSTPTGPEPIPTLTQLPQPVINFPVEGVVGQPVTFDGSESQPGANPIGSYTWDFGDGNSGGGAMVEHIYDAPGVYNVTLTVTDTAGFGNVGGPVQITINEAN